MLSLTRPAIVASTKRAFASTSATLPRGEQSIIPLSNVEAQWATLSTEEQAIVHRQLADLQKRDWKSLSRDEKKAGQSIVSMSSELSGLASGRLSSNSQNPFSQLPRRELKGRNADGLFLHTLPLILVTALCTS